MKPRRASGSLLVRCPCGRLTNDPRKGQCPRCAQHAHHGRRLEDACEACGAGDRRALVRRRLEDRAEPHTVCGNCAAILGRRRLSLAELAADVGRRPGDRRQGDRRAQGPDRRRSGPGWSGAPVVLEDRRQGGRRASDRAA